MTEITSHMIQRYFRDESTEEEIAVVRAWLLQHPDELDHYLTEAQWEQFQPDGQLPEGISASMYGQIEAHIEAGEAGTAGTSGTSRASEEEKEGDETVIAGETGIFSGKGIDVFSRQGIGEMPEEIGSNGIGNGLGNRNVAGSEFDNVTRTSNERKNDAGGDKGLTGGATAGTFNRRRAGWRLPAAAAMLAVMAAAWYFTRPAPEPAVAKARTEEPASGFLENKTGKPLAHRLPDGSGVLLQPGASLRYKHPFVTGSRNITLSGKARFNVARNPAPFTVSAGKTSTTALGTVFEISSLPGNATTVLLISGKVKVQAGNEKDIILRPGEQLRYDASLHSVQVSRPAPPPRKPPTLTTVPEPKELIPTTAIIHFDNTPLTTLFRQLESREKLHLLYDPALLRDRYFTGSYNSGKESLDDFLQTIAVLNNLQIRLSGDSLLITP